MPVAAPVGLMLTTLLVVFVGMCALVDVRHRRIPNRLTVAGLLCGLIVRVVMSLQMGGAAPLLSGLLGMGIAFALSFPLFAARAMGGGDVKMLTAVGTIVGGSLVVPVVVASAVAGGVLGVMQAWRYGMMKPVLRGCRDLVVYCASVGRRGTRPRIGMGSSMTIPYGVAIAGGAVSVWLMQLK